MNDQPSLTDLNAAAEAEWLERWTAGPTEGEGAGLPTGAPAPGLSLVDDHGDVRSLSEFWVDGPALLMFWRHFGCSGGAERAARLVAEWSQYQDAGLNPVIISQGEPERAAAYRAKHALPAPVLSDPDHTAYRAYGVGHWPVERVLFDAPERMWTHSREEGEKFLANRREQGRPPVDDPWRAAAEFVVGTNGLVRLTYYYQHCEDFPDARVLTTAARLSAG
ncbi:hypothetical protein BH09ACT4_BH09ACT4_04320 [soil metagenome]